MSPVRSSLSAVLFAVAMLSTSSFAQAQTSAVPSTVVAKQGDVLVTLADIDAFAARMPENERPGFFDSPKRLESLISNLLVQKRLAAEARQSGLDKDPGIQGQIALAADDVLGKARLQQFKDALKIPDFTALAREDYIGHKEKYQIAGKLDVKHILISTKSRSEEEAKTLAETVEKEAKAHPDQFDSLIEKYSEDPSKANNHGLMTEAGSTRYVAPFAEASKALKKSGEISPIVKTEYGFHVIQLVDRSEMRQRSFEEVKPEIIERLRAEFVDKSVRTFTDTIRNQSIDANPELVESLRSRYGLVPLPPSTSAKEPAKAK